MAYPPQPGFGPAPQGVLGMPRVPWSQNAMVTALGSSLLAGNGTLGGAAPYLAQTMPAAMAANTAFRRDAMGRQEDLAKQAQMKADWNAILIAKSRGQQPPPDALARVAQSNPGIATKLFEQATGMAEPPTPTDDMREFEFGQKNPAFNDWLLKQRQAGGTTVNVGPSGVQYPDPPAGYDYARNPDGSVRLETDPASNSMVPRLVPIPGGKPAADVDAARRKDATKVDNETVYGDVVLEDIKRAKEKVKNQAWYAPVSGVGGQVLKGLGGSAAADTAQLISTIESSIAFDRLQAMRESSPTGGALGAVTERELALLKSTLGSLEQAQSADQLLFNLDRLETIYTDVMRKAAAYPNAGEFGFASSTPEAPTAGVFDWSPDAGLRPAQ